MINDVATSAVGLIIGLLTGYYFEWRSSSSVREQNAELHNRLKTLRESIYAVNGSDATAGKRSKQVNDLSSELLQWLLEYQGPDGMISRVRVVKRFLENGYGSDEILAALTKLDEGGHILLGEAIEIR